jgi:bifunctional non-homologous end joining protein LigD
MAQPWPERSCIIDGEAVACDDNGVTSFNRVRYRYHDESIFLYVFDLIELNGDDDAGQGWARHPLQRALEGDGDTVFRHACKLGLEGIVSKRKDSAVSKRKDSAYRSGRSRDWIKSKNPAAPAVKREAEEDWGNQRSW